MFEALAEAIETLVVPAESDALVEVFQLYGRLAAKATLAAGAFDLTGGWELDGSASMTAWMRVHLDMTNQQANRVLRRARRVRALPTIAAAWEAGRLSSGQIEIIVANLVLLCSRHHHRVHLPGWHIKLLPTGTVEVTDPQGNLRTSDPPHLC